MVYTSRLEKLKRDCARAQSTHVCPVRIKEFHGVSISFFPIRRMKENFMELYLVREQFQSDIIGKDNF